MPGPGRQTQAGFTHILITNPTEGFHEVRNCQETKCYTSAGMVENVCEGCVSSSKSPNLKHPLKFTATTGVTWGPVSNITGYYFNEIKIPAQCTIYGEDGHKKKFDYDRSFKRIAWGGADISGNS